MLCAITKGRMFIIDYRFPDELSFMQALPYFKELAFSNGKAIDSEGSFFVSRSEDKGNGTLLINPLI